MYFQLFVILNNCYFVVLVILRLLMFFVSFTEFLCVFIDFRVVFVVQVASGVDYAGNSVS